MGLCLYRHLAQRRLEALLPFRLCCCVAYHLLRPSRCPLLHYCCHNGSFMSPVFWTGFTSGFTSGFTGGSLDRRRTVPVTPLVECRLQIAPLFWALLLTSRHFPPCLSACGFGSSCFFWGDGFGGTLLWLGAYFKLPLAPIVSPVLLPTLGRPIDCYLMLLLV